MFAKSTAAIVGSGATPYYFRGASPPQTITELIGKAVFAAVEDAGLTIDDVDGLAFFAFGFDTGMLIEQLGLKSITFAHCVSGFGGGTPVWTTAVTGAFSAGRGLALAVTLCGTAIAQTLSPITAQWLISTRGWRTAYVAMGLGWGSVALRLVLFFLRCA